ncbi:MAG: GNAT family N-acetyltransferase [Alphaproteobacteria bacterium]
MTIILETERCKLREFDNKDTRVFQKLYQDIKVNEFAGGPKSISDIKIIFKEYLDRNNLDSYNQWAVVNKMNNNFIGEAGLTELFPGEIEIGFRLFPKYWNKGLATEICLAIIKWAFVNLKIDYIIAVTRPENIKSQDVLLKLGMNYLKDIHYNNKILKYYRLYRSNKIEE